MGVEDLLERHLAVELAVQRDEDFAQASLGMGPEYVEPLALGGGGARGEAGGAVGIFAGASVGRAKVGERGFHIGIVDAVQALAGRAADGDRGQAPRCIAPVPGEMGTSQAFQKRPMRRVEVSQGDEMFGKGPGFVAGPRMERGDQLPLVDQAVLKREQSEEEVARWVGRRCHGCRLPIGTSQTGAEA